MLAAVHNLGGLLLVCQHGSHLPALPTQHIGTHCCAPQGNVMRALGCVGVGVQNPGLSVHAICTRTELKAAQQGTSDLLHL